MVAPVCQALNQLRLADKDCSHRSGLRSRLPPLSLMDTGTIWRTDFLGNLKGSDGTTYRENSLGNIHGSNSKSGERVT